MELFPHLILLRVLLIDLLGKKFMIMQVINLALSVHFYYVNLLLLNVYFSRAYTNN